MSFKHVAKSNLILAPDFIGDNKGAASLARVEIGARK
jgi:hypothetical protein